MAMWSVREYAAGAAVLERIVEEACVCRDPNEERAN